MYCYTIFFLLLFDLNFFFFFLNWIFSSSFRAVRKSIFGKFNIKWWIHDVYTYFICKWSGKIENCWNNLRSIEKNGRWNQRLICMWAVANERARAFVCVLNQKRRKTPTKNSYAIYILFLYSTQDIYFDIYEC